MLSTKIKQVFAFEDIHNIDIYKSITERVLNKIEPYLKMLEKEYSLNTYPNTIVWTSRDIATTVFSDVPIPAYTNERFICITPDLQSWKSLYLDINNGIQSKQVIDYFNNLSESFLLQLLGHEITHHLDLFLDEFDDNRSTGIWFEEGMCEYLSKKYLLNNIEYNNTYQVELDYINYYKNEFGNDSIELFGSDSYSNSMNRIMYDYYRSSHIVELLVEKIGGGNPHKVFDLYKTWDDEGRKVTLSEYFNIDTLTT